MAIRARKEQHGIMLKEMLIDAPLVSAERPDQRRTSREKLNRPAIVTVGLGGRVVPGELRNVSAGGTQLRLGEPLSASTLIRVEYDDNLLLGEIVYCQQEESHWLVGLRIEHGLFGLAALAEAMIPYR